MDHQRNMHDLLCAAFREVYRVEKAFSKAIGHTAGLASSPEAVAPFSRMQQDSGDQAARLKLADHMSSNTANDPPPKLPELRIGPLIAALVQAAANQNDRAGF